MRIGVIGAGGVGGFLGAVLMNAGHDVRFLARGQHLAAIKEGGLHLESRQFGDIRVRPLATDDPHHLGPVDLVIAAVKMYDFDAACAAAKVALEPEGTAITIQNGLDAPDELAKSVGSRRVLIGTATIEATILGPARVGHLVPIHSMTLSEFEGGATPRLEKLVSEFHAAGLTVVVAPDGKQALWNKAASLIPFATITSATGSGIGPVVDLEETRALFNGLVEEARLVAQRAGYDVGGAQGSLRAGLTKIAAAHPEFTSSMSRDFQRGKPTELEWLTGKIVRLADSLEVPVPLHRTLYALLKLRQESIGNAREVPAVMAPGPGRAG